MPRPDPAVRAAILTAVTELVATRGFSDVSLDSIIERAGVGVKAFHRHFADSEDAFCAAVEAGTNELLNRALPAFASQSCWVDGLRAVAYELRDFLVDDPARARVMVVESFSACDRSREVREEGMAAFAALIDFGRAELDDPDSVPVKTAELTAGAVYNRIHIAVDGGESLSDEMVRDLMYIAVRPYLGPDKAFAELELERP